MKAKVVAGIVLALRFAYSLLLVHGHLTANNIFLDSDHNIEIVDFHSMLSEVLESEGKEGTQFGAFSRDRWKPKMDVDVFRSLLCEVLVGRSKKDELAVPRHIPTFVATMIKSGFDPTSETGDSFNDIPDILKTNNFRIEDNVNSADVSAFANWVESAEEAWK
jgi:hypothetical protein